MDLLRANIVIFKLVLSCKQDMAEGFLGCGPCSELRAVTLTCCFSQRRLPALTQNSTVLVQSEFLGHPSIWSFRDSGFFHLVAPRGVLHWIFCILSRDEGRESMGLMQEVLGAGDGLHVIHSTSHVPLTRTQLHDPYNCKEGSEM